MKRPVPRFLYASASKWTLAEYEFLNVDDEVQPWRDMLHDKVTDKQLAEDEKLQAILSNFQNKVRDVSEDTLRDMRYSNRADLASLARFYELVQEIVTDTTDEDSHSEIFTKTPSPKEVKRVRYDRAAKVTTSLSETSIPKSSSLQSISSVTSDKQGQREAQTRRAFFDLLDFIFQSCAREFDSLLVDPKEFVEKIQLQYQPKPVRVENDGCIRLRKSEYGALPFLNIECKSRAGSSSAEIYQNIFAQEFAESLAIMLARINAMKHVDDRSKTMSREVYSIGVHHRRAYIARVFFEPAYIEECDKGMLNERRVTVVRSEQNYRLDDVVELKELVTMIYCLCKQFIKEVNAGRLV